MLAFLSRFYSFGTLRLDNAREIFKQIRHFKIDVNSINSEFRILNQLINQMRACAIKLMNSFLVKFV